MPSEAGSDYRRIRKIDREDKFKGRFAVIDGNQMMFMLLDDEKFHPNYDVGVWINTEFFAQALEHMFDMSWDGMKPVK